MMQKNLVLNPNSKDGFALAEKFCYFVGAPAKSGVGIRTLYHCQRPLTFICYGGLLRAAHVAGRFSDYGSSNPLWPTSISFEPNAGRKINKVRGTAMKTLWCYVVGVCQRFLSFPNDLGVVATPLGVQS